MSEASFARVRDLFDRAADLEPSERSAFLARECAGDELLRTRLERMLDAHGRSDAFMGKPVATIDLGEVARGVDPMIGRAIGAYVVRDVLGRGGMGVVYRAEQERPRRAVALKLVRSSLVSPLMRRRFEHEAHVLARLKHPGIAQIYEAGAAPGPDGEPQPFFAMELVRGKSLLEYVRGRDLAIAERLVLFVRICEAVHHAHQRGVIHRDLKPGNILVEEAETSSDGPDGSGGSGSPSTTGFKGVRGVIGAPKILDFGVARVTDRDLAVTTMQTSIGQVIGTLQYMSPEQAMGQSDRVDVRSDVYSLGVILYELLAGQPPYDVSKRPVSEAARVIAEQEAMSLRTVDRAFRGDLETIVHRAMEKDPERRYASVADFAADVERYLGDRPIIARPASTMYQIRKFTKRNKVLVGGVCATMLVLMLGVLGTGLGLVEATAARHLAEDRERIARAEARKAEQSVEFLVEMLTAADPEQAQGREVTVREILDQASSRVERDLGDEPDVEASIRTAIGKTYLGLGLRENARPHLEAARVRIASVYGEGAVEYAQSLSPLVRLANADKDHERAIRLAEEALRIRESHAAADDPALAETLGTLGQAYAMAGAYSKAEPYLRRAVEILERAGPSQRRTLGLALDMLASAVGRIGGDERERESVRLTGRAVEALRDTVGESHPQYSVVLFNHAFALEQVREYEAAQKSYEACLQVRRRIYEGEHPRVLSVRNALAALRIRKDELDAAEAELEDVLQLRKVRLGSRHPDVARTIELLASIAGKRQDQPRQAQLLEEALEIYRVQGGVRVASAAHDLALLHARLGQNEKAEALFREALEARRGLGQRTRNAAILMSDFGAFLSKVGAGDEAATLLRESVGIFDDLSSRDRSLCSTLRRLGSALVRASRFAEAEVAHRRALDLARTLKMDTEGAIAKELAAILEATGKREEAERLRLAWPAESGAVGSTK